MSFKSLPPEIKSVVKDWHTFRAAFNGCDISVEPYPGGFDAVIERQGLIVSQGTGETPAAAIEDAIDKA